MFLEVEVHSFAQFAVIGIGRYSIPVYDDNVGVISCNPVTLFFPALSRHFTQEDYAVQRMD